MEREVSQAYVLQASIERANRIDVMIPRFVLSRQNWRSSVLMDLLSQQGHLPDDKSTETATRRVGFTYPRDRGRSSAEAVAANDGL
jgi:hypothetical protein